MRARPQANHKLSSHWTRLQSQCFENIAYCCRHMRRTEPSHVCLAKALAVWEKASCYMIPDLICWQGTTPGSAASAGGDSARTTAAAEKRSSVDAADAAPAACSASNGASHMAGGQKRRRRSRSYSARSAAGAHLQGLGLKAYLTQTLTKTCRT